MSIPSEKDHLDPNNPMYYAPRRMREEANAKLPASTDAMLSVSSPSPIDTSPSPIDTLLKQAIAKSFRTLDPVPMYEPPANGPGQWRELIPNAGWLAAAVGLAAFAALFFVIMNPASKTQAGDSDASSVAEASKAASAMPKTSSEEQPPRDEEVTPALAEFGTVLAAGRIAQPTGPGMTHEESEALLQQFVRWQQKLGSTDTPPQ